MSNQRSIDLEAIKRLARGYESVIAMADELEKLGSVEKAITENEGVLQALRESVKAANADLEAARAEAQRTRDEAATALANANTDAADIVAEGNAAAERARHAGENAAAEKIAEAERRAQEIIAGGEEAARQRVAEGNRLFSELHDRRDGLLKSISEAEDVLRTTSDDVNAKQAELASVQAQLDAIRAKIG